MNLISHNPFRILGTPVTATDRQLEKQYTNIALYADMDKEIKGDLDSIFLNNPLRGSIHIQEAKQSIELPQNKLFYATAWFWENSNDTIDDMAFEQVKTGNIEKAIQFWTNETEKGINPKNKSNFKNLSTIHLGFSIQNGKFDKFHFMKGLALLGDFLEEAYFKEFSNQVLGNKHSVSLQETSNLIIDEILNLIKPFIGVRKSDSKITNKELFTCFKTFPKILKNDISEKFIGGPIHKIEERIKTCENDRNSEDFNDGDLGYKLWDNSSNDLKEIQSVLSKSDLKYQLLADKLAEEIIGCSISHFNRNHDSNFDPGDVSLQLLKYAKSIAVGDKIKDRISDNQPTIEKYVNSKPKRDKIKPLKSDFDFIYDELNDLLNMTKVTKFAERANIFLSDCKPKLDRIKNTLGESDEDFIDISDAVVNSAINKCIELLNTMMKASEKVNDNQKNIFFQTYMPAVEKVFDKLKSFTMSNDVRDNYNELYKNFRFGESNSDGGCYIATMVYGSYDAYEVLMLRNFRDRFLLKYDLGKKFVKIYYMYSPGFVRKTKHLILFHNLIKLFLNPVTKIMSKVYDK
jgi:hypothetical protein